MSVVKKFPDTLQGTIAGKKKKSLLTSRFSRNQYVRLESADSVQKNSFYEKLVHCCPLLACRVTT